MYVLCVIMSILLASNLAWVPSELVSGYVIWGYSSACKHVMFFMLLLIFCSLFVC